MNICPNAYYNYLKNKKHAYRQEKAEIQRKIVEIYHRENGVPGYRMMNDYLSEQSSFVRDAESATKLMMMLTGVYDHLSRTDTMRMIAAE